jgi:hypothetical protein
VVKRAARSTVGLGGELEWTIVVTNRSNVEATDVRATDIGGRLTGLPDLRAKLNQGQCIGSTCFLGTLGPRESATIVVFAKAFQIGSLANTVRVSAAEPENNYANNTASTLVRVNGPLRPPPTARCGSLTVNPTRATVGARMVISATTRDRRGRLLAGVHVRARGAGVTARATTNADGVARLAVTPPRRGLLRVVARGAVVALLRDRVVCGTLVAVTDSSVGPRFTG